MKKSAWVLGAILATAAVTTGAAVDDDEETWTTNDGQVIVVDENGDKHEWAWSEDGDAGRGWVGITLGDTDHQGAQILGVLDDSPAWKAGLEEGDIIVAVDGEEIRSSRDLTHALRGRSAGDQVELEVLRGDDRETIPVELGERPHRFAFRIGDGQFQFPEHLDFGFQFDPGEFQQQMDELHERLEGMDFHFDAEAMQDRMHELEEQLQEMDLDGSPHHFAFRFGGASGPRLGVQVVETTPELREFAGGSAEAGVLVGKVLPDSPAESAGVLVGDLIVAVDGATIRRTDDIRRALSGLGGEVVNIDVIRDGSPMTLQATLPEVEKDEGPRFLTPSEPTLQPIHLRSGSKKA